MPPSRGFAGRAKVALQWLFLALVLHLAWEIVQLPLYTIYREGERGAIAYAVAHCTGGDLLISLACYALAAEATRSWRWPLERRRPGIAVALVAGLAYTAFSEWLNVSVRGSWAYSEAMPQVFGIGLAPLAQWLVVPLVSLSVLRAWAGARR